MAGRCCREQRYGEGRDGANERERLSRKAHSQPLPGPQILNPGPGLARV
jgi:hypothetical protein